MAAAKFPPEIPVAQVEVFLFIVAIAEEPVVPLVDAVHIDRYQLGMRPPADEKHDDRHDEDRDQHDRHGRQNAHGQHVGRVAEQVAHDRVDHADRHEGQQQTQQQHTDRVERHGDVLISVRQVLCLLAWDVVTEQLGQPFGPVQHGCGAAIGDEQHEHEVAGIDEGFERDPFGDQHTKGRQVHAGDRCP